MACRCGMIGQVVPRVVEQELNPERGHVTILLRPMGAQFAVGLQLRQNSVPCRLAQHQHPQPLQGPHP